MPSPFRYPGGKSKASITHWILSHMPEGVREYREPFVGGGGVFFALPDSVPVRWISDLDQGLIAVYLALRDRPEEFIAKCRAIEPAQPGEPEVATRGTGKLYNKRLSEVFGRLYRDTTDDLALRYFFLNRTVWAGRVNFDPAYRSRAYFSNPGGWNIVLTDRLEQAARCLAGTKISCVDYSELLETSGEGVFIFCDPPYLVNTEFSDKSKLYAHNFTADDHRRFSLACRACRHKLAISYDDHPVISELFPAHEGWWVHRNEWKYCGTPGKKKTGKEVLITNY